MTEFAWIPHSRIAPLNDGHLLVRTGSVALITDPRQWACSGEAALDTPNRIVFHTGEGPTRGRDQRAWPWLA
jgi:hypothetical protein